MTSRASERRACRTTIVVSGGTRSLVRRSEEAIGAPPLSIG
jgi:hypothetical protein